MPPRVTLSETAKPLVKRMGVELENVISLILEHVPPADTVGLAKILVATEPPKSKVRNARALAAYFRAFNGQPARAEIYINNIFGHLRTPESLGLMLPVVQIGLAEALFHEIGHHVQHTRAHGITKKKAEPFATRYAKDLLNRFVLSRANSINECIAQLEATARGKNLSTDKMAAIQEGWASVLSG